MADTGSSGDPPGSRERAAISPAGPATCGQPGSKALHPCWDGEALPESSTLTAVPSVQAGVPMAPLTIRDLDEGTKAHLRIQATRHGRPMEEEARTIDPSLRHRSPASRHCWQGPGQSHPCTLRPARRHGAGAARTLLPANPSRVRERCGAGVLRQSVPVKGGLAVVVLDTTVISELMRPEPEPKVLAWADGLEPEAVAITAMNEGKILHGLAGLPDGRRKQHLHQTWDGLGWPGGRAFRLVWRSAAAT